MSYLILSSVFPASIKIIIFFSHSVNVLYENVMRARHTRVVFGNFAGSLRMILSLLLHNYEL